MLRILLSCMRKTKNTNFPLKKFENQREVYGLEPDELFDFEYELASLLDDWKTDRSAVDMAEEVETIRAYLLERKNWKGH